MGKHRLEHQSTPTSNPPAGYSELYFKSDGNLYALDESGNEIQFASSGTLPAHASTHENGGADEISVAGLSGTLADPQAPTSHASSHQNGGGDEISVAGLSGVLADEQDAGSLKGSDLTFSSLRMGCKIYYDETAGEWKNEPLPLVPYGKVLGEDWAPSWSELYAFGHAVFFNTAISVTSHVGNGSVSYLNGISATAGDSYTVTDSGTLTAGSLAVGAGAIVYWTGSAWAFVVPHDGSGYVRAGVRVQLSTTTALIAPYTDGTDDGKIFAFDGTDNTGNETTADLTFTLPAASGLPNDGMFRGPIYVGNFSGDNELTVDIASSGAFSDGLVSVLLSHDSESIMLGAVNGGLATTWMRISTVHHHLQVRRAATWASSNFGTPTPVPFDTEDHGGNPDVSYWDNPTNPTRLYAAFKGEYHVSGFANIDSTGGFTWTCEAWVRKNGTTEVTGTRLRTGNYGNEDQAITLPPVILDLDVGDYIEWIFDHSALSGNLNSAMLGMEKNY